ncbi:MAG: hypothetical protein FJZ04_02500 [Candidatus Moranbacteria bacterium]|nr:hypothetical protein [Candidatus Moranbacteria bacterium]
MEEKIKQIRAKTIEVLKTYFTEDAQVILQEIKELKKNPTVKDNQPLLEELGVYEALTGFIAFASLKEEEQLELFRIFLVKAFRVGIDVRNRFSIKMNLTADVLWPETAEAFLKKILQNEEKIGTEMITIQGEKEPVAPTLSNWLRDYNRRYGMDRHEKIVPHRYLNESGNIQKLNREEKILLLQLLEFYEELKFPSQKQIETALKNAIDQYVAEEGELAQEISTDETGGEAVFSGFKNEIERDLHEIIDEDINSLLKRFPKLSDQPITQKPIRLLFNDQVVNPTVGNWLADYRAYAGAGSHEISERSDYLLRSRNVQNLSDAERNRLGLILRSYDEGFMLPFSVAEQKIAFEKIGNQ